VQLKLETMVARGGDDLEDDYEPDELVAQSEEEGFNDAVELAPLEGEEDQFIADDDTYTPATPRPTAKDRTAIASAPSGEAKREKKRKKRAKDNERKAKVSHYSLSTTSQPCLRR
jgi:hypothetical protein